MEKKFPASWWAQKQKLGRHGWMSDDKWRETIWVS